MIIAHDGSSPECDHPPQPQQPIPSAPPQNPSSEPPPPYPNNQTNSQYIITAAFVELRESAERRFFRALFVAVSIWVLAGIFVSSAVELHKSTRWNTLKDNVGTPNVNIEDGHVDNCVPWAGVSAPEHRRLSRTASGAWSRARLNLPTDADALYLLARGARMSGDLYVSESPEANHVSVTVFVYHRDEATLSHGTVCRLSRGGGQMGVGIFSSLSHRMPWHIGGSGLHFVVDVGLPPTHGAVRYIPSFHADLPMFALTMGDLSAFRFSDVTLRSSNNPIKAEGLVSKSLEVSSMNGAISGNFNTTNSLTLVTTNSPVSVRVGAENGESEKPTEVVIRTDNALIEADISLTSKSSLSTGGTFGVHAHTTNGPITIVYRDSPVDSVLNFDASSTNSPIHAVLHDAYEGEFSLLTTNSKVVLDHQRNVEDPSGLGRKRRLSSHSMNGQDAYGEVEWFPSRSNGRAGSVDMKTTNKMVKLYI